MSVLLEHSMKCLLLIMLIILIQKMFLPHGNVDNDDMHSDMHNDMHNAR